MGQLCCTSLMTALCTDQSGDAHLSPCRNRASLICYCFRDAYFAIEAGLEVFLFSFLETYCPPYNTSNKFSLGKLRPWKYYGCSLFRATCFSLPGFRRFYLFSISFQFQYRLRLLVVYFSTARLTFQLGFSVFVDSDFFPCRNVGCCFSPFFSSSSFYLTFNVCLLDLELSIREISDIASCSYQSACMHL